MQARFTVLLSALFDFSLRRNFVELSSCENSTKRKRKEGTMSGRFALSRELALCVILALSGYTVALEKYWLPDLEWQTASNWADGRVPEIDSHVIFPEETRHAVGIAEPADLRLSALDLSRQGSLVLPRNGKLQLSHSRADARVSRWSRKGNFFWVDPANWNGSSIAAPHLEQLPCRQDSVVLPNVNRTLSILLPINGIEVKSIRPSNEEQPFTRWQWRAFQDRREFVASKPTVNYAEYSCPKCTCQKSSALDRIFHYYYLEEICTIQEGRCGFTACEYPLKVEGHCCPYCGGRVSTSTKSISLAVVRITADEALEGYAAQIAWHVRRTLAGGVEVLVKSKGDYSGVVIQEAVENLREMLRSTGIDVSVETAGAAIKDSRLAVALGPFLGAPAVVIVLLLLAFLYFGYSLGSVLSGCMEAVSSVRDGIRVEKQKHGFARFENVPEGNVQIADVAGTSGRQIDDSEERIRQPTGGGRFENPLYRSKRDKPEEREMLDTPLSLAALKGKVEGQLENVEMDSEE
ncbi:PREDICTED: protein amnionless-like [Dinoponera quadriceps]|uniref:Protein amnionless n=1 Tax=Dinoponera quadriceps TaxID=609295 RepID=A0A6P3WTE3_DINQU|nr:PREDICTED: protein amnionless-like [Dinoponera quadriceps]